jgi:hypothetical protein
MVRTTGYSHQFHKFGSSLTYPAVKVTYRHNETQIVPINTDIFCIIGANTWMDLFVAVEEGFVIRVHDEFSWFGSTSADSSSLLSPILGQ